MSRLSKNRVKKAIPTSAGIISTIARRLSCDWHTAKDCIDGDPELSQMLEDEMEGVLDMAESVVYKSAKDGNTQDAKWLLSKKGKDRGYGDSVDLQHSGRATLALSGDQFAAAMRQAQAEADEVKEEVLAAGWDPDEDTV